jgi:hypothetical protein
LFGHRLVPPQSGWPQQAGRRERASATGHREHEADHANGIGVSANGHIIWNAVIWVLEGSAATEMLREIPEANRPVVVLSYDKKPGIQAIGSHGS